MKKVWMTKFDRNAIFTLAECEYEKFHSYEDDRYENRFGSYVLGLHVKTVSSTLITAYPIY